MIKALASLNFASGRFDNSTKVALLSVLVFLAMC